LGENFCARGIDKTWNGYQERQGSHAFDTRKGSLDIKDLTFQVVMKELETQCSKIPY
jgi:hypothetical protein